MRVSLQNIGHPIVNGFAGCNIKGDLVVEIITDSDTERSFLRGLEESEEDLKVSIGCEGERLFIYKQTKKGG